MALSTITFMNKTCIVYEGVKNVKIMRLKKVTRQMVNMWKQDSSELFCNLQTISCLALSGPSPVSSTLTMMVMMMITVEDGDDQDEQGDINCGKAAMRLDEDEGQASQGKRAQGF